MAIISFRNLTKSSAKIITYMSLMLRAVVSREYYSSFRADVARTSISKR